MDETTRTDWLRVADAARLLGVSANTVRRWTDAGRLAARRSPGGHRRYRTDDVLALLPAAGPEGAPRPGDVAQLRNESDHLHAVVAASLELTGLMTEAPHELPQQLAQRLCELTGVARCDVYALTGDELRLIASQDGPDADPTRVGEVRRLQEWTPVELNGHGPHAVAFPVGEAETGERARQAMQQRGCRSLAWAPMISAGRLVGSVELSDTARLDLRPHLPILAGFARLCAQGLDIEEVYRRLERRERAMQELTGLSREIAETHDVDRFVLHLADRLMTAVNADDVDIWRVKDGRITCLVSLDRNGQGPPAKGSLMRLDKYPTSRLALERLEPLVVNSLDDPRLSQGEVADYRRWGYSSSLMMPLVAAGRLVGIVDLWDDAERDWSTQVAFLTGVLQPVAGLFDNAVLLREVEQYGRIQEELADLSMRLARGVSLRQVADEAARRLREMTGAEDCDVWWLEEGHLRCLSSVDGNGVDESVRGKTLELQQFPTSVRVMETGEPIIVAGLDDPILTDQERDDWLEYDFRSLFSLPLVSADETVGMIDIFDVRERDYEDVRDLVMSASAAVAAGLKTMHLMEGLRQSNSALRELVELSDEMNDATDLSSLARTAAVKLRQILQAEDCDVWHIDDGRMVCLASMDSRGWDEEEIGSERELAVYAETVNALSANEPIVINDLEAADIPDEERAAYARWGYRSMVSLPLVADGRPVGLVDVFDTKVRDYRDLLDFIRSVGRLLAGAFEKALLLDRLAGSNRELRTLVESSMELGASLDVAAVLDVAAHRILDVSGADICDIYRLDGPDLETLISVGGGWPQDPVGMRFPLTAYRALLQAERTRRPVFTFDVLDDPAATGVERKEAEHWGYRSSFDVPIFVQGVMTGAVSLYNREPRPFAHGDLVVGLAHAAGQALANAALYGREAAANREARLLNEIVRRTAASLDLEEIVAAAVDELRQSLCFDHHDLMLFAGGHIERVIDSDREATALTGMSVTELSGSFMARLHEERVVLLRLPEESPLPGDLLAHGGYSSAAIIALPSDTGPLGTLSLLAHSRNAFGGVDVDLLERVATQLSLAITNARLYDEIKQMHLGNLKALSSALNAKDYYTLGHAARVATYMMMLGRRLGWDADLLGMLEEAAYLHDIGKISISDRVLLKPGRLNEQEWQQMREHPVFSADIIKPLFPAALVQAVRHHHERFDGKGYPDGLAGEEIPLLARAMTVVDSYDAMSCWRPYKAEMSYAACLDELERCRGTQFDPVMVDAFLGVLEELAGRHKHAQAVARQAADRIPSDLHRRLHRREDEGNADYEAVATILRETRDANPPTRFLTTHLRIEKKYVIGVDPEEDEEQRSHFGDEIFEDAELVAVFGGEQSQSNTVYADEFGVWVTGLAPMRDRHGEIVAVVAADLPALRVDGGSSRDDNRHTFASMLQSAAVRLNRAEIDAITDALTGLYNHRYLHERLSEELHRARETGKPLSVLFCDLDNFKQYNDANGHSAGDDALRNVSHIVEQAVRNVDVAARYGGEEFVVLLVETAKENALMVAERLRRLISSAGHSADGRPLTISVGVASYPDDGEHREDLLQRADAAMYAAKHLGRDRVVPAGVHAVGPGAAPAPVRG